MARRGGTRRKGVVTVSSLSIRLTQEEHDALYEIGEREDRGMTYVLRRALRLEIARCQDEAAAAGKKRGGK
jgi:predicted transcriptional regulator